MTIKVRSCLLCLSFCIITPCFSDGNLTVDPSTLTSGAQGTMDVSSLTPTKANPSWNITCNISKADNNTSVSFQVSGVGSKTFGPVLINGNNMKGGKSILNSGHVFRDVIVSETNSLVIENVNSATGTLYFKMSSSLGQNAPTITIDNCNSSSSD